MIRHRISQRNTALRSPREIVARLGFAAYVLALPAGGFAFAWGATHSHPALQIVGGAAVVVFAALHVFGRKPLGFSAVVQELKRNPFKAGARDSGAAAGEACVEKTGCRSCGSL
ncbi:MAG TPA: hypothetical protein VK178_11215 [Opitutaceae bacterium]|nr:hypothetical protein [Opitutaceae bacterium]